jgi:hypothetical protein
VGDNELRYREMVQDNVMTLTFAYDADSRAGSTSLSEPVQIRWVAADAATITAFGQGNSGSGYVIAEKVAPTISVAMEGGKTSFTKSNPGTATVVFTTSEPIAALPSSSVAVTGGAITAPSRTGALTWTYVGPSGNQLNPGTVMIPHTTPGLFDSKQGDNIAAMNIPIPNDTEMLKLYRAHPEYFTENAYGNFVIDRTTGRGIKEQIDSRYVEANTRWNRLRLNLGVREERTRTLGQVFDVLPTALVRAAGFTANTIPYLTYQYRNFERRKKYGGYENLFFSGGAKYALTKNLNLQVAASQSIGRPDYNNLAGIITVNDTNFTVAIPNPDLKPETSDKYFASVQ